MRIVFMATAEIAEPAFSWLLQSDHEICGLVTQPDRPVGRKQILTAPEVKNLALAAGVPVIQPEKVRDAESLRQLREWAPDLIVVMAYGQILPQSLIEIPTRAIINLHASLLPLYRGAACIQAPLREGDAKTGWSVIHVVKKLDAGQVILKRELEILEGETGGQLHDRLAALAPSVLQEAIGTFNAHEHVPGEAQDESAVTYVPKLLREDGLLDWAQEASVLERMIRAYYPWPGTYTLTEGKRLKIFPPVKVRHGEGFPGQCLGVSAEGLEIACGVGSLLLTDVQAEGKRRMTGQEFCAGRREIQQLKFGEKSE